MSRGIYHIEDPLENFKIRIRIREIYRPHHARENIGAALFEDDITISWQEKLFGPRDVLDYIAHKGSTRGASSQLDSRRHLAQIERSGKDVTSILNDTMIYTYINDDPFVPNKPTLLDISDGKEAYISYVNDPLSEISASDDRAVKVSKRLNRERQKTTMHVCLAADVNKDTIKSSRFWMSTADQFSEFVLLTIQLTKSGVMVAAPPFSHILPEGGGSHQMFTVGDMAAGSSQVAASVFLDDATVIAGMQKGFQLGTYRVRTAKGSEFEYSIENVNGVLSPVEIEDLMAAESREDMVLAEQSRGFHKNTIGSDNWQQKPIPEPFTSRSMIYAEIVSASGFGDGESIYIKYQAALPKNWQLQPEDTMKKGFRSESRGEEDSSVVDLKLHSSERAKLLHGHTNSSYTSAVDDQDMVLHGMTQLNTVSFCRNRKRAGLVHVERGMDIQTISVSIPIVPAQFLEHNSFGRYLIGWCFLAVTGLSVLMGLDRPLWVVPALVFIFVLGTGSPGSAPQVVVSSEHLPRKFKDQDGGIAVVGDLLAEPCANFGHVFTADVLVNDQEQQMKHTAPSASKMTLFFEVYSVSAYRRHTLEGCGYTSVSSTAGEFEEEITTWKPIGDFQSTLADFFVGGGAHLSSVRFMEIPNKSVTGLSKFGSRTESSGTIRFRYRTVQHTPSKAIATEDKAVLAAAGSSGRRTIEDILNNYRNVDLLNKSMSRKNLKGLNTPMRTPTKSSRSVFGEGDDNEEPAPLSVDKVAEMIAKARQSANSSLSAKASGGSVLQGAGNESASERKPMGGIAMMRKRPLAGGYAQLDGTASDEDDFLPRDTQSGVGGSGYTPSLVDRLEQSGLVHDKQSSVVGGDVAGKSQQKTLPKLSGGGLFSDGGGKKNGADETSSLHIASNTPTRGRKDRYSDSEED